MNISTQAVAAALIALMPPAKPIEIKPERMIETLAPHPLYFTIDGRPARTTAWVDHRPYIVDWDTVELRRIDWPGEEGKGPNGNGNGNRKPPNKLFGGSGSGGDGGRWNGGGGNNDDDEDKNKDPEDPEHYNTLNKFPEMAWLGCLIFIVVGIFVVIGIYFLWKWWRR
jgi:hypothetical protein